MQGALLAEQLNGETQWDRGQRRESSSYKLVSNKSHFTVLGRTLPPLFKTLSLSCQPRAPPACMEHFWCDCFFSMCFFQFASVAFCVAPLHLIGCLRMRFYVLRCVIPFAPQSVCNVLIDLSLCWRICIFPHTCSCFRHPTLRQVNWVWPKFPLMMDV